MLAAAEARLNGNRASSSARSNATVNSTVPPPAAIASKPVSGQYQVAGEEDFESESASLINHSNTAAAALAPQANETLASAAKWENELEMLVEMRYDRARAGAALNAAHGDIDAAVAYLDD